MPEIPVAAATPAGWQRVTEVTICSVPEDHEYAHHFSVMVEYTRDGMYKVRNRGQRLTETGTWVWGAGPDEARWPWDEALDRAQTCLSSLRLFKMTAPEALADWEWWQADRAAQHGG